MILIYIYTNHDFSHTYVYAHTHIHICVIIYVYVVLMRLGSGWGHWGQNRMKSPSNASRNTCTYPENAHTTTKNRYEDQLISWESHGPMGFQWESLPARTKQSKQNNKTIFQQTYKRKLLCGTWTAAACFNNVKRWVPNWAPGPSYSDAA